jgi:hypothetical protein
MSEKVRLNTLGAVRTEMASIYRALKRGDLESQEATRRVYVLKEIRCCLESEMLVTLEERMAKIQGRTQDPHPNFSNGSSMITVPAAPARLS